MGKDKRTNRIKKLKLNDWNIYMTCSKVNNFIDFVFLYFIPLNCIMFFFLKGLGQKCIIFIFYFLRLIAS